MGTEVLGGLRGLEGRNVHLSLSGGGRLDDVALVSVSTRTIWVFVGGEDAFVPADQITDFWEAQPLGPAI